MVDRLAKMESVVKDFSRTTKLSNSPSNSLKNEVYPNAINSIEAASLEYRASGLVFEDNETISMWDPPMSINGSLGSTDAEPLNHADVTELEVEYTGRLGVCWVEYLLILKDLSVSSLLLESGG